MKNYKLLGSLLACLSVSTSVNAVQIDFTGGTAFFNAGGTGTTNNSASYQGVSHYEEAGFRLEYIFSSAPTDFSTIVGDYYNTGNDVAHSHWTSSGFGEVDEVKISKIDGSTFDLGGFRVSTNTAVGGGASTGDELVWVNSSKANNIFSVLSDDWGLGAGPDPLITIAAGNSLFDDILWFSFTNDAMSSAEGLGLDNFFLDEEGDAGGTDPTVPAPLTMWLLGLGLTSLLRMKKQAA